MSERQDYLIVQIDHDELDRTTRSGIKLDGNTSKPKKREADQTSR